LELFEIFLEILSESDFLAFGSLSFRADVVGSRAVFDDGVVCVSF
jgi:hypothetical protein